MPFLLGLTAVGTLIVLLQQANKASSAPAVKQQTYVERVLADAKSKTTAKGGTVDKAKTTAKKTTAEVRSAINAIDKLLS